MITADHFCVEILRSLEVETSFTDIPNPHKGTCDWIYRNELFNAWLERPSDTFWLRGQPGAGKTIMSKHLAQSFQERLRDRAGVGLESVYFGFSSRDNRDSVNCLLRSLAHQLLISVSAALSSDTLAAFAERQEISGADCPWEEGFLLDAVRNLVQRTSAHGSSILLIIDGVDECQNPAQIVSLLSTIRLATLSPGLLWACALSRPHPDLQPRGKFEVEMDSANNSCEIEAFVRHNVREAAAKRGEIQPPSEHVKRLAEIITERSAGMILKARLMVQSMFSFPKEHFIHHIRNLEDLELLYEAILRQLCSYRNSLYRETAQRALLLVLHAKRTLTTFELCGSLVQALGLRAGHSFQVARSSPASEDMQILNSLVYNIALLSGGLLAITALKVRQKGDETTNRAASTVPTVGFVHVSVREFLLHKATAITFAKLGAFPFDAGDVDFEIAGLCLCYIDVFSQESVAWSKVRSSASTHFLRYAVFNVMGHISSAAKRGLNASASDMWEFQPFQPGFLVQWIELYRSLSGNLNLFEPHKSTAAHIMAHFDIPWLGDEFLVGEDCVALADKEDHRGLTPLSVAAARGHLNISKILVEKGANINHLGCVYGKTPLALAAAHGNLEVARLLLDAGADIGDGEETRSPLWMAVSGSHSEVVKLLTDKGANVEMRDPSTGQSLLSRACAIGHGPIVRILLNHGAEIGHQDKRGWTALHYAISMGKRRTVEFLVYALGPKEYKELKTSVNATHNSWVATVFRGLVFGLPCDGEEFSSNHCSNGQDSTTGSEHGAYRTGNAMDKDQDRLTPGYVSDRGDDGQGPQPPFGKRPRPSEKHRKRLTCPYRKAYPQLHLRGSCVGFGFPSSTRLK